MNPIDSIPRYITAKTKDELVKKMLQNNAVRGAYLNYFQIQNIDGEWIAWFYPNKDNKVEVR
jgi:cellobiose phosphorylase